MVQTQKVHASFTGLFWSIPKNWRIFIAVALLIGSGLRVMWGSDIEYKYDEHFMFERTQKIGVQETLPWIGMPSGVGTRNPAMSIWVFLGLSRIFLTETPPELARAVEILNIVALLGMVVFILGNVEKNQKQVWLWAAALCAVNPLYVLLQRKIWAQSTLPLFCVLLIYSWWKRDKAWGSALFGFMALLVGQIHMSGFFFSAALVCWTLLFSHELPIKRPLHKSLFAAGCAIGTLPLLPWISSVLENSGPFFDASASNLSGVTSWMASWDRKPFISSIFWQFWATDPTGLGLWYSLGPKHFEEFLAYPLLGGTPTYCVGAIHGIISILIVGMLYRSARATFTSLNPWKNLFLGIQSDTDFLKNSALWGYGILISILGIVLHRHYLIITFPLEMVWLTQLVFRNTRRPHQILGLWWVCQLLLTIVFLYYIHVNHGAPTGDYGIGYQYSGL